MSPKINSEILFPFEFIDIMNEKRALLKQIVKITRAIEKMRESLEAVVVLGQPSSNLSKAMLTFHRALSIKTERQPTDSIKRYLIRLEEITRESLSEILRLAHVGFDMSEWEKQPAEQTQLSEHVREVIREFQRRAMTAVSLKVLLHRRGVYTPGATIPVPIDRIQKQVFELQVKEQSQRNLLKRQITEIRADIQRILANNEYSDEMVSLLRNVFDGLEQDLRVINAGGRLGNLHFSFERIEAGEEVRLEPVAKPTPVTTPSDIGKPVATGDSMQRKVSPSLSHPVLSLVDTETRIVHAAKGRMGFFRRLWLWLNTPWWISWKKLDQVV